MSEADGASDKLEGDMLTGEPKRLARHALGLPNDMARSYRNRFLASGDTAKVWAGMVEQGYAERGETCSRGMTWFWLTREGAEAALDVREGLCPEDFPPAA